MKYEKKNQNFNPGYCHDVYHGNVRMRRNHKSPEGVDDELIKNYVSGSEKKVKQCYSQEKDTNELLQNEIDATLKYFAAHNPTKVKVEQCDILSENGDYTYVYIIYNLVLENDQEYPCVGPI